MKTVVPTSHTRQLAAALIEYARLADTSGADAVTAHLGRCHVGQEVALVAALVDHAADRPIPSGTQPDLYDMGDRPDMSMICWKAMYAGINGLGITDADRLPFITSVIDRTITTTKEMTEAEARAVLAHIDQINEPVEVEVVES